MKTLRILLLASVSIALAACSTFGGKGGAGSGAGATDENGVSSNGLGSGDDFGGTGAMTQAQLLAKRVYYFAYDKTTVNDDDVAAIEAQAKYLVAHPTQIVLITGNTDERGSREYNIGLGWRRAQSVSSLLVSNGVPQSQIKLVSYGAEQPSAYGHDEDSYAQNRRVVLMYCQDSSCQNVMTGNAK